MVTIVINKEDEKLINEFMNWKTMNKLLDWNILMQIVNEIESLDIVSTFEIGGSGIFIWSSSENNKFDDIEIQVIGTKENATYKAIIEFLKLYNEHYGSEN